MILDIVNFSLALSIGLGLLWIGIFLKQKSKLPALIILAYLIFLFIIDTVNTIYILNSASDEGLILASKMRLVIFCFMIAIAYLLTSILTSTKNLPKFSASHILIFIVALLLSIAPFFDYIIPESQQIQSSYNSIYTSHFWGVIAFLAITGMLAFREIFRHYQKMSRWAKNPHASEIIHFIFPLTVLSLALIHVSPFFWPSALLVNSGYLLIALLFLVASIRYQLLPFTEDLQYILPQAAVSALFLLIFFIGYHQPQPLAATLLSVPGFLLLTLAGYLIVRYFKIASREEQTGYNQLLDSKIEQFSTDIVQIIDIQQLWEFVAKFSRETFGFPNIAIISKQYDVKPYQIAYLEGFSSTDINDLLSNPDSPLLEKLELDHQILNKFNFPASHSIHKMLDQLNIHWAIPLIKQHELNGIILIGGDSEFSRMSVRHMHLLRLMSSQVAIAIKNIHNIEHMIQSQKMAGIGMLASQLAHDFKSFVSLAKLHSQENSRLMKHASYMEKMVQDLLNYARPQELKLTSLNINQLIDMSLDLIEVPPYLRIEKHYYNQLPKIEVDINQMRRALTNLLNNSIRAMRVSNGNRIKISTRPLRPLSSVNRNPWIYIEILDEGIGIPEEFLERIFDPFFTTYKSEGGNGLGLAIVKQIITRHSGFIDVSSKPGKGTIFNIRLPYQLA